LPKNRQNKTDKFRLTERNFECKIVWKIKTKQTKTKKCKMADNRDKTKKEMYDKF